MLWFLFPILFVFVGHAVCDEETSGDLPSGVDCAPGTTWKDECNSCRCVGGIAVCGRKTEPPRECAPNTSWKRECNICVCTKEGKRLCTEKDCDKSETPRQLPSGENCAPDSTWIDQCNACICLAKGYGACTRAACVGADPDTARKCASNTAWKRTCNTCICTHKGKRECTENECPGH